MLIIVFTGDDQGKANAAFSIAKRSSHHLRCGKNTLTHSVLYDIVIANHSAHRSFCLLLLHKNVLSINKAIIFLRRLVMTAKGLLMFVLAAVLLVGVLSNPVHAQMIGTVKDVETSVGSSGKIDWTTSVITAVGIGAPPANPANPAQARAMAERAAQVVAYRNLLESVKGVRVDSQTTVENFMVTSDVIRTQVSGFVQGAMIMDKKYMSDGSVEVTVGMKLTGALADQLLPKTPPAAPMAVAPSASGQAFTGLIVDARGLGVRPAMAPKVLNEDGKEVYGSAWINRDWAVREGMVGYLKDQGQAQQNPRVTDKPLMVKAIKTTGDARVDVVISNADAAMLQGAAQNLSFLEKCRVIILVD